MDMKIWIMKKAIMTLRRAMVDIWFNPDMAVAARQADKNGMIFDVFPQAAGLSWEKKNKTPAERWNVMMSTYTMLLPVI